MERLLVKLVAFVALAGCSYRATYRDCLVSCSTANDCPQDFTCGGEGVCRAEGATASCADVLGDAGIESSESSKALLAFELKLANNPGLSTDALGKLAGRTITAEARFASGLTALVATFATNGARVSVRGVDQISGHTANDFSVPVTYTVTARDGSTADYTVSVIETGLARKVDFAMGSYLSAVTFADIDGDGRPDLVANAMDSVVARLDTTAIGAAVPSFDASRDVMSWGPRDAVLVDINHDDKPDLVTTSDAPNQISIAMNQTTAGAPGFATPTIFPAGGAPEWLLTGDLDGDGNPDVVAETYNGTSQTYTITVVRNTTAAGATIASLVYAGQIAGQPGRGALGDVNGDGKLDLLVLNRLTGVMRIYCNTSIPGQLPTFSSATTVTLGITPLEIAIADLNGDGKPDLALTDQNNIGVSVFVDTTTDPSSPSFSARTFFATGNVPEGIAVVDINGDQRPDLVSANAADGSISILLNVTPALASAPTFRRLDVTTGGTPVSVAAADVNGDGRPDLAIANSSMTGQVSVFLAQ